MQVAVGASGCDSTPFPGDQWVLSPGVNVSATDCPRYCPGQADTPLTNVGTGSDGYAVAGVREGGPPDFCASVCAAVPRPATFTDKLSVGELSLLETGELRFRLLRAPDGAVLDEVVIARRA